MRQSWYGLNKHKATSQLYKTVSASKGINTVNNCYCRYCLSAELAAAQMDRTYLSCSSASGKGKGRARGLRGGCRQALLSRRQHLGCRCKQTLQLLLLLPLLFTPCIMHSYVYVVTPVAGLVADFGYSICSAVMWCLCCNHTACNKEADHVLCNQLPMKSCMLLRKLMVCISSTVHPRRAKAHSVKLHGWGQHKADGMLKLADAY